MTGDALPTVDLDTVANEEAMRVALARLEEEGSSLVEVKGSIAQWDRIREAMMVLRASNLSTCLLLRRGDSALDDEELEVVFGYLKLWDQFTLHNFLELCSDRLPQGALAPLRTEAKFELKWFREWSTAATDERLHKYPGLPWRRFIRKITAENHAFVTKFLELIQAPKTDENLEALKILFQGFLAEKKKVVNLFPKRWNRAH